MLVEGEGQTGLGLENTHYSMYMCVRTLERVGWVG